MAPVKHLPVTLISSLVLSGCLGSATPSPSSALERLDLKTVDGITLSGPPQFAAQADGIVVVGGMRLANNTSLAYRMPFSFTILYWDGGAWTPFACSDGEPVTGPHHLCALNGNVQVLGAGEDVGTDVTGNMTIAQGPVPPQHGYYAFVLPLWAGHDPVLTPGGSEYVEGEPSGAVAIVTQFP
jgi:hypothetical protein